ncbi:MAG: galactarate dehydratase [Bryobacterales bacterium]|nr:galactarate dehydratase [Bryobacterales bacterium]
MQPLYVRVHARDNVAIIVNPDGVRAGDLFAGGLTAAEAIPQSHKIVLRAIAEGEPIVRYGEVIGTATRDLSTGAWVREDMLRLPTAPALDELPLATATPADPEPLEGHTFNGYRNADGSVGTKNILGITTTVQCVAPTVDYAVRLIKTKLLPRFPNVDDVVAITHTYGCGVAIDAPGAAVPIRTLGHIAKHPNFGGAPLVVSLGCEKLQPSRLLPHASLQRLASAPLPVLADGPYVLKLQDQELRGFESIINAILGFAEKRLAELDKRRRTSCPASELSVGLQCGGSDAFSGVTCNPAVGYAADLLVRAGATVMFSEVTEVRDAVHLLTPRAANREVARDLIREMRWYDEYLERGSADRSANPTPGNKRGGLANVVEKALGSVAKAGTTALKAVATHGERVTTKGLVFAATPASDFICGTQQLASMNMHVFTTGEGSPYGLALVPVVKVSSRTALAERWFDLIDLDAGPIATGEATIEDVGWELFRFMLDVASGRKKTWADHWGLHNALAPFNPGPVT